MNINYIGMLLEYCQRERLPLPNYNLIEQPNYSDGRGFRVSVKVDGQYFISAESCIRKKQAEQSAAQVACKALINTNSRRTTERISTSSFLSLPSPSLQSSSWANRSLKHMPSRYADIEQFILSIISPRGGRIRKIWDADEDGRYQFEITGTYRYCGNIRGQHRKNHIYFLVDPIRKTYYQKCHDPECSSYQSSVREIPTKESYAPTRRRVRSPVTDMISS